MATLSAALKSLGSVSRQARLHFENVYTVMRNREYLLLAHRDMSGIQIYAFEQSEEKLGALGIVRVQESDKNKNK